MIVDSGSSLWGGEKSLQRVIQTHHVDQTKSSKQVAREDGAGSSTVMQGITGDAHSERGGCGTGWEGGDSGRIDGIWMGTEYPFFWMKSPGGIGTEF